MTTGTSAPSSLEISEQEVVDALNGLPQGHTIDWLGGKGGAGTFDRKDGVALRVYKNPCGFPGEVCLYSGDISPAAPADGYDSTGYPTREDATLGELVAWLASWDGSEVDLAAMLARAPGLPEEPKKELGHVRLTRKQLGRFGLREWGAPRHVSEGSAFRIPGDFLVVAMPIEDRPDHLRWTAFEVELVGGTASFRAAFRAEFPSPVRAALRAYANQWPASAPLGRSAFEATA